MPDITKCQGFIQDEREVIHWCPKAYCCYRYRALSNLYCQAYFSETPFDVKTGECKYFWEDETDEPSGRD